MATVTEARSETVETLLRKYALKAAKFLASLKLTVASFAASVVLIFVGTLAQVDDEIWRVMAEYFKPWALLVPAEVMFPSTWFPSMQPTQAAWLLSGSVLAATVLSSFLIWFNSSSKSPLMPIVVASIGALFSAVIATTGKFPFFGGATIGTVMIVNLLAAHSFRFQIRARGVRLIIGLVLSGIGAAIVGAVVVLGHDIEGGIQGSPPFEWETLWTICKTILSAAGAILFLNWFRSENESDVNHFLRHVLGAVGVVTGAVSLWLWITGDATYLGDSAMRVLWQLMQSMIGGWVLLGGLYFLFNKRAGVVELHLGILLMMFGQWFVANYDVEEQMMLAEGQTKNYAQDIRSLELAVIDSESDEHPDKDDVFAIPLMRTGKVSSFVRDGKIESAELPFTIEIVEFMENSNVEFKPSEFDNVKGDAAEWKATENASASGTDGDMVNIPSLYVRIKDGDDDLGVYLLSIDQLRMRNGLELLFDSERIEVDDKTYDLQLRFARRYKPYSITLIDVRKEDYLGTSMARHFASEFRLVDEEKGIDREVGIWMNNPLRFGGETFYQQSYNTFAGKEYSTIQIVQNQGWMVPYVSCMLCLVGMLFHFGLMLSRFLRRSTKGEPTAMLLLGGTTGLLVLGLVAYRRMFRKPVADSADSRETVTAGDKADETTGVSPFLAQAYKQPITAAVVLKALVPWICIGIAAMFLVSRASSKPAMRGDMNLSELGRLPMAYQGRVKPFDTLARNSLKLLSTKETFACRVTADDLSGDRLWKKIRAKIVREWPKVSESDLMAAKQDGFAGLQKVVAKATGKSPEEIVFELEEIAAVRQPAIRWLIDAIAAPSEAIEHRVIKVSNPEVLVSLGLKRRKGYLFSTREIIPGIKDVEADIREAKLLRQQEKPLSADQAQLLDLDRKLSYLMMINLAFNPPELPEFPTVEELRSDPAQAREKMLAYRQALDAQTASLKQMEPPLVVAPLAAEEGTDLLGEPATEWQSYAETWPIQMMYVRFGGGLNPSFEALNKAFVAYANQDADEFNKVVRNYHELLLEEPPEELVSKPSLTGRIVKSRFGAFYRFEEFFNKCAPFLWASWLYAFAFLLCAIGWLGWTKTMNRSAYGVLWLVFAWHTLALIARIYISGRPPVTNLYSSAVFIGWGAVLFALLADLFYRNGIMSVAAAVIGFSTLQIAHYLAGDGDTFRVLVAVLDTQFWLATHVTSITLGYAATYLAGLLGMVYVLAGIFTPKMDKEADKQITRMIYGTTCFAISFSLIGTVLGGLWADDSWGRFWGWDPKENGALLIVLWNALILHARWDGLVKGRGLALLAIAGNIITTWSWFGVNELGVGFHSYGFSEGRLMYVARFIISQLLLIGVGCLPKKYWWSSLSQDDLKSDPPVAHQA